jgi:hypothetical protein
MKNDSQSYIIGHWLLWRIKLSVIAAPGFAMKQTAGNAANQ